MKFLKDKSIFDKSIKFKMVLPICLGIIGVLFSLLVPLNFKKIIDSISQGINIDFKIFLLIFVLILLQLFFQIFSDYWLQKIGISTVGEIRLKIISKVLSLRKSYFDSNLSGDVSSILVNDASALSYLLSTTIPSIINSVISVVLITLMLFYLSLNLSIVIIVLFPIMFLIYLPIGRILSKVSLEYQDELGKFNHYSQFITTENNFIKTAATEKLEYKKGQKNVINLMSIGIRQAKVFAITTPLFYTVTIFGALLTITYGIYLVQHNFLTLGSFVAYITLFIQILNPLSAIGDSFSHIRGIDGAIKRIFSILNEDEEDVMLGNSNLEFSELNFKSVDFTYNTGEKNILNDVTFKCDVGKTISIVGPSGSGKTTIFSLIEQFYTIDGGKIYIDGQDISSISLNYLRSNIGYVSQQYPLILGTVRDNLVYGIKNKDISDDELIRVSKLTNFFEVINKLPEGLNTFVGDKGVLLSEGQKQRLSVTRVLLLNPKILLLDEITSALDSYSEKVIQNTLEGFGKDKITIMVAHRLSTVKNSDFIIFLENGKITGIGNHEELYSKHDLYKSFVQNQLTKNM